MKLGQEKAERGLTAEVEELEGEIARLKAAMQKAIDAGIPRLSPDQYDAICEPLEIALKETR